MEEECLFNWKFNCNQNTKKKGLTNLTSRRIETIIKCSKQYGDNIHENLDNDSSERPRAHKTCVDKYCHPTEVRNALKRQQSEGDQDTKKIPPKRARRSELPQFNFIQNCFFCGEVCNPEKDPKNPTRWRPAFVCRQVKRAGHIQSLEHEIIDKCDERNDTWASEVRVRLAGVLSDLHAADARYHRDCRTRFMFSKNTYAAEREENTTQEKDAALELVIQILEDDLSKIWNSVELHTLYEENGGHFMSRRTLVTRLSEHFNDDLLILSSPGIATILAFKSRASKVLRVIPDFEDDDCDIAVSRVTNKITKEVRDMCFDRSRYNTRLNHEEITENVSSTVLNLLACLSSKLDNTLPAYLVGNIITSVLANYPTQLQISLGVLLRDSKELVKTMNDFGVTCTYDELLRFKKSAAVEAAKNTELTAISNAGDGLVQIVVDNFDADISSQNGKLSTHSLAVLMTQPDTSMHHDDQQEIPRLKKAEMSRDIDYKLDIMRYNGPKKPGMPPVKNQVPPLSVLAHMVVSRQRANECDLRFFTDVVQRDNCPEFNGYNTHLCRDQGEATQPKTKAVYLPLIDMPPAHPDTIMTAMGKSQQLTEKTGQGFTVFTADQQLYRVAVEVQWAYPNLFPQVIPRLGGMHMLMSFVGAVGTLMTDSGLADVLASTFAGVGKMLTGKKFPMNMRAMRMVAEELLRDIVVQGHLKSHNDLMTTLEDLAKRSRTTKMWVDNLIKPVLIMMLYVRAEREGDWPLHLEAVKLMMPYFFASGHVNYARYGLFYLRRMEALPGDALQHFMKGSHVMRHTQGIWNGIWSDMFIETTFMRYGHGKAGVIGITLKPETLKTWALSLHICSRLVEDVSTLRDKSASSKTAHKEEAPARISADQGDRDGLRKKLDVSIDPMDPEKHPSNIVNVVNGRIAPESVNVDRAVEIGAQQMGEFERKLPGGFYDTISKKVKTMAVMKKSIDVGDSKVYDTKLIYSRVIGLQASSRDVNFHDVMSCELSPVPTALFDESGDMRISKSKAALKNQTKVEVSARHATPEETCTVIDGCALLWIPTWPSSSPTRQPTVMDFVLKFKGKIEERLKSGDVYLVFDRYNDYSTKCATRISRGNDGCRVFQLSPTSPLPSQKLILTVTENKKQLINIICKHLQSDAGFIIKHKLVITSQDDTPVELVPDGVPIQRNNMATSHEEADVIIVQQAIMLADEGRSVRVLADDTDVYVLLLHFYQKQGLQSPLIMESPIRDRSVIDIHATVDRHRDIIPSMLAGHALTGCDTVGAHFGVGKGTLLKVLRQKNGFPLPSIGDIHADMADVMKDATALITACYGQPKATTLSNARVNVWTTRVGKAGATNTPNLAAMPPTTEAFKENVKRAHLQTWIWKSALELNPSTLDPTAFGYMKDEATKSLIPVTTPPNVKLAPANILRLIRCNCASDNPCKSSGCGCNKAKLSCTMFCACHASVRCLNDQTLAANNVNQNDIDA